MFVELFILMYKTQNYRHKNFSIKLFLPWWKKIHLQWIFTNFIWGKLFYCSHKLDFFFFFNTMKHILFSKAFPVPEVFPVVLLQMFTSTTGRWRDVTSNVILLHSRNGCPLMNVRATVRAVCRNHTQKPQGFHFQQELSRKKPPNIAPSLK